MGNASSTTIPLAIHDAVRDGVTSEPMRIFAPGFGAGAVAGYSVVRIDPEVVAISAARPRQTAATGVARTTPPDQSADNVGIAFG